jgi:hypothetical protein
MALTMQEIRNGLHALADEISNADLQANGGWADRIREFAEATRRRPAVRRSSRRNPRLTEQQGAEILKMAAAHPELHQSEIAAKFGVNPGRVSETLAGFREE